MGTLPVPDLVLSERLILNETRIPHAADEAHGSASSKAATVCDVLQLAARRAVGCAVGPVEGEPALVLSPDCKHLAVKEPCSRRVCLLSAQDGFKEVLTTLGPLDVCRDGQVVADTVLSCSWSADSNLLLVACKSSAVYLFDSTGRLLCHWDPTWSWAQLQLVAACHGPDNTIFILTAARVVFQVAHSGATQQHSSSAGSGEGSNLNQHEQHQVLNKYSVKRFHTAVSAFGYDVKSGLLVIAGDSGITASSSGGYSQDSTGDPPASPAAAFDHEGLTVSVWQLHEQELRPRFHLGKLQPGPGLLARTVAGALGLDRPGLSAAAATQWSVVFSPLLEYVALLTGSGSVYLLSLTDSCLVDPASGFAGRSLGTHTPSSSSSSASGSGSSSPRSGSAGGGSSSLGAVRERPGTASKAKHIPLTPFVVTPEGAIACSGLCNRAVAWWGPRVLAVAAQDGSVSLVRLPESVNILGAVPPRFAPGARVAANHTGSRGLLVVEPISAAAAAAAAGTTAAGAAAAVAHSMHGTSADTVFAADASAAVGVAAVLAAKGALAAAATPADLERVSVSGAAGSSKLEEPYATWAASKLAACLKLSDCLQDAAAAAEHSASSITGWRLVLLAERTPQQLVQVHLRLQDWGSAKQVSQAYGLDTDVVWLARWSATPVSKASIQDNLPKITSERTRIAECLTRIAPDYESARTLISYGLRVATKHALPPSADGSQAGATAGGGSEYATPRKQPPGAAGPLGTPGGLTGPLGPQSAAGAVAEAAALHGLSAAKAAAPRWWRLQRLKLLALHDRLETCVALKRGTYDPELFSTLRTEPLPKAAAAFAAAGNVAGLSVLLQRHKSTLAPRLLQLLSALPESLDPRMYAGLVPRASANAAAAAAAGPLAAAAGPPRVTRPVGVGSFHVKGMRKVDWVESEDTFRFLFAAASGNSFGSSIADEAAAEDDAGAAEAAAGPPASAHAATLHHALSMDAQLPISTDGSSSTGGSSRRLGFSSSSNLDFSSWAINAEEAAVMLHATEEMERYCSVNGANRRTLPTDAEIATWLASRALQLDAATGQLPHALQLLELAVDKGYGQFLVPLPLGDSSNSMLAAAVTHASVAAPGSAQAAEECSYMPLSQLLVQGRVLLQLVQSWWPAEEQQQQQLTGASDSHKAAASALLGPATGAEAGAAAAAAAPAVLPPLWSVTLQQWVAVGPMAQLLAVMQLSSRDRLHEDLCNRVLPLLECYPHEQRIPALQELLIRLVVGTAGVSTQHGSSTQQQRDFSSSGVQASSSGSSSSGIVLAAALLAQETELLQAAAAASDLVKASGGRDRASSAAVTQRQQRQLLARAAEGSLGSLVWGGDVAALVAAVLAAVTACQATNQWARVEALLDAAADAAAAAAAVNGVAAEAPAAASGSRATRTSNSSDSSYGSAASNHAEEDEAPQQQQRQEQGQRGASSRGGSGGGAAAGTGWGEGWSSEGEDEGQGEASGPAAQGYQQQQQDEQGAALLAATEQLRDAVLQHPVDAAAVQQLQAQLTALRGQVRAARLLTKHGCSVCVGQVVAADGPAAKQWLAQLLGRAERLGLSWPEAQWAQVWHDLLEAQQSGLSAQLPAADLAAAFLRVLLLSQQYHLAVQLLPVSTLQQLHQQQQQQQHFLTGGAQGGPQGVPVAAAGAADGMGPLDLAMDASLARSPRGTSVGGFLTGREDERPSTAEAALAALTGGPGGAFTGKSRFGVRRALHNAAGAAVSTAVGSTAKLMGVSAHLVGSTAHLVGSTAQAVQHGTGGVVGATAGLVSGTASLVTSAAIFAAEAAAKASSKAGLSGRAGAGGGAVLRGALGLLSPAEAEAVVVQVSRELLGSAASLEDPAVAAAEAVLQLLPPDCKVAAAQRDTVAVLRRLPEFGVCLLPAQLTSLPDKHQLLQRILFGRHIYAAAAAAAASGSSAGRAGSSVAPWRRLGDVLELAALLGLGSEEEQNEVRLLAAEAALSAGEVGVATHLCLQLAAVRFKPAWHLAAELACPDRYTTRQQQRAAKAQELAQQEQQMQQQLRESQQATNSASEQQQDPQSGEQAASQQPADAATAAAASAAAARGDEVGFAAEAAGAGAAAEPWHGADKGPKQLEQLQLAVTDGDASSASVVSPTTPSTGAAAAAAKAAGRNAAAAGPSTPAGDLRGSNMTSSSGGSSVADGAAGEAGTEYVGACAEGKETAVPPTQPSAAEAIPQPPTTPVSDAAAAAAEALGAAGSSNAAAVAQARAKLALPPKDRQKLLAFAACYCPATDLPALTDDLVAVQHEVAFKDALRQKQRQLQQQGSQQQQQQSQLEYKQPGLMLPLQQPAEAFEQQRQQLLQEAVAAAAGCTSLSKGQLDPYRGLLSFGDPHALLAVLLSSSSPAEAQQLLEDALATQLSNDSSSGSSATASGSYCCLQRLLVGGTAAQLLLLLQPLPQPSLEQVAAASPGIRPLSINLKLPQHQQLLLQVLHAPLAQLQSAARKLQQQQLLPPNGTDVLAAAADLLSRLQQIADGRQLLQWLPGIETGRFFAGDKQYQEQVLIQLASKAGQLAVQPQQPSGRPAGSAEALMAQAQQLAASYGADPFQLELWFVHSLLLYAQDINAPGTQGLLRAHTQQLLQHPAAAAAHLYYNTYPLLPAAAAGQCACVLGLIHTALQACCVQLQQPQHGSAGAPAAPAAVTAALPQLDKLRELLLKSSKALSGLAAKAVIGGHVALMVGPAVAAAAAAMAANPAAAGDAPAADTPEQQQQQQPQGSSAKGRAAETAAAAAAAAVANVDLPMVLLEATSAVSAYVDSPSQAATVSKFIRHLNTLAEMHAKASVGDRAKQQQLRNVALGVSAGLPHLLLFMKTMSGSGAPGRQQPQQEEEEWAEVEERSSGLTRSSSVESFESAVSASSSSFSSSHAARPGHHQAAALAIEWATARARYASSSGRQQLLSCSALQLSALAGWLVLAQQQPVSEEAVGPLQPLAMGPGLQLQLLSDVMSLVTNPDAQLPGLDAGSRQLSGGSSRGSSIHQGSISTEQAAATAVAAAAALAAGADAGGSTAGTTPLMRDEAAALAAWRPPSIPSTVPPKRLELVLPLLQAACRIVAKHITGAAVTAAAVTSIGAVDNAAVDRVAAEVSQLPAAAAAAATQEQEGACASLGCLADLLAKLLLTGSFPAVAALQLACQLSDLRWGLREAAGNPAAGAAHAPGAEGASAVQSRQQWASQQAYQTVSHVLQQLTQAALDGLQQHLAGEQETGSSGIAAAAAAAMAADGPASAAVGAAALRDLQLLVSCLDQDAAAPAPAGTPVAGTPTAQAAAAAAVAAEEGDTVDSSVSAAGATGPADAGAAGDGSWLADGVQQLRSQLWEQLQQHQAQLPAEAYSNRLVAELLELHETICTGTAWPGWSAAAAGGSTGAAAAAAAAAAASGASAGAGGRPTSSGAGLLLARTMTALSKQFPGCKASADDLASLEAATALFSRLVSSSSSSSSPLSLEQCVALCSLLTDTWREGAALPQPQPAAGEAAAGAGAGVDGAEPGTAAAAGGEQQEQQQQQEQELLPEAVGLPAEASCRVSQLHSCWHQLLGVMLSAGYVQHLLALLDRVAAAVAAVTAQHGGKQQQQQQQREMVLPLTEPEAQQLVSAAEAPLGPAGQAVLGLLLPYRSCQQDAMERVLQGKLLVGSREPWAGQLLLLVLLREQLAALAAAAAGQGVGAAIVGSGRQAVGQVGHPGEGQQGQPVVQQQQLYHLYSLLLQPVLAASPDSSGVAWAYLTCLFPHAVAQLCAVPDYASAAALVAAKMRTCGRLCAFDGSVLLLQRYLEITMQRPWQPPSCGTLDSPLWLPQCEQWMAAAAAAVTATAHGRLMIALRQADAGLGQAAA